METEAGSLSKGARRLSLEQTPQRTGGIFQHPELMALRKGHHRIHVRHETEQVHRDDSHRALPHEGVE